MLSKSILHVCFNLLIAVRGTRVNQWPLDIKDLSPQSRQSAVFDHLRAHFGDRAFEVSPIAKPCYTQPKQAKCKEVIDNKSDDYWLSGQPGGYYYGNWASCQAAGEGCAIPLNDSVAIAPNATCYQGSVPGHMINVSSVEDIQIALQAAQKSRIPVVIKNTGHDWKGRSSAPGSLGLWIHHLRPRPVLDRSFKPTNCQDHPTETVIRFGGGEQWAAVYDFANQNGLAVLGGTCPTVGIAGWLQGGGHSPLTPWYGMGADNVRQVTIVIPTGEIKVANECQNPGLFFAVRGGGGGFGVITELVYKAVPKFQVQELSANLSSLSGPAIPEFVNILTSNAVTWSQKGWGGYIKTKTSLELVNANSTASNAASDMAPLLAFFRRQKVSFNSTTQPSWYTYYEQHLKPPSAHIGQWSGAVASRLLSPDVFSGPTRATLSKTLLDLHNENVNLWLMLVTPTRFNHTKTSAVHPSWATAIWSVRINDKWDQYSDPPLSGSDFHAHFARVHQVLEPLRELVTLVSDTGVSINEADIWEDWHAQVFWGRHNFENLRIIKDNVDPDNMLTHYQAIGWKRNAGSYMCYPKKPEAEGFEL